MKKYLNLLVPIVVLLVSVPVGVALGQLALAKIAGVVLVVLTSISLRVWMSNASKEKQIKNFVQVTANELFFLKNNSSWFDKLSHSKRKKIESKTSYFLSVLDFDDYEHKSVTRENCLIIAFSLAVVSESNADLVHIWKNRVIVCTNFDRNKRQMIDQKEFFLINPGALSQLFSDSNDISTFQAKVEVVFNQIEEE